jgi:hypothetical protein
MVGYRHGLPVECLPGVYISEDRRQYLIILHPDSTEDHLAFGRYVLIDSLSRTYSDRYIFGDTKTSNFKTSLNLRQRMDTSRPDWSRLIGYQSDSNMGFLGDVLWPLKFTKTDLYGKTKAPCLQDSIKR